MKTFAIYVRNISLLLCGGLILYLYLSIAWQNILADKDIRRKNAITKSIGSNGRFSIYSNVILKFVPALKSRNSL
ncbi:hypothetical protein [Mucilaginibacter antarcticus]|uniref:Uncharacterized protein n=1 Tax=Mucilaginibacter antarcticus TaxID=1855725 RepID=A0ABW5XKZ7_9SPHI